MNINQGNWSCGDFSVEAVQLDTRGSSSRNRINSRSWSIIRVNWRMGEGVRGGQMTMHCCYVMTATRWEDHTRNLKNLHVRGIFKIDLISRSKICMIAIGIFGPPNEWYRINRTLLWIWKYLIFRLEIFTRINISMWKSVSKIQSSWMKNFIDSKIC